MREKGAITVGHFSAWHRNLYKCYKIKNPSWLPSWVIAFTRFSENVTSDLWPLAQRQVVSATRIQNIYKLCECVFPWDIIISPGQKVTTGQGCLWIWTPTPLCSSCSPEHGSPPASGSGQLQLLYRVTDSAPQVLEQGVHSDHSHQPPDTKLDVTTICAILYPLQDIAIVYIVLHINTIKMIWLKLKAGFTYLDKGFEYSWISHLRRC